MRRRVASISLKVPAGLKERIDEIARKNGLSRNKTVILLLEFALGLVD